MTLRDTKAGLLPAGFRRLSSPNFEKTGRLIVTSPAGQEQATMSRLLADPAVASVEPDRIVGIAGSPATDPQAAGQWSLIKTGMDDAWDISTGSPSVVIAVIDTGVRTDQPDLIGQTVPGYDFVNRDSDPYDDYGHGTVVATVIAALRSNGYGGAGICPGCRIMPIKVLSADGYGYDSDVASGIVYAVDHGAAIINLSLGGAGVSNAEKSALQYAASHGVVVVAAAGNNGANQVFYPAAGPSVISVGATDFVDRRISWSNYGSWVTMVAPGCVIGPDSANSYHSTCGTSFASPQVAAVAGLIKSVKPDATPAQIRSILLGTAALGPIEPNGVTGPVSANGRLDASAALLDASGAPFVPGAALQPSTFPVVLPGESISPSATAQAKAMMIPFATTTLRQVFFSLIGDGGAFSYTVYDKDGSRRALGTSRNGSANFNIGQLFGGPNVIRVVPSGPDPLTVTATVSIDPAPPVEPLAVSAEVAELTDLGVDVRLHISGGLPTYEVQTWLTAWQMKQPYEPAEGDYVLSFKRSCATDMTIRIKVTDQVARGTSVWADPLVIPKATGCPPAPFAVTAKMNMYEVGDPKLRRLDLGGTVSPSGSYYYQWHAVDPGAAITAFLPDSESSWYGSGFTVYPSCTALAEKVPLVLVAYSIADTQIAAVSAPIVPKTCPVAATPKPKQTLPPAAKDKKAPTIIGRSPAHTFGFDRDRNIRIRFSEPVKGASLKTIRIVNTRNGRTVTIKSFRLTEGGRLLIIDPKNRLVARRTYRIEIHSGIKDHAGNKLKTRSWTFTTGRK